MNFGQRCQGADAIVGFLESSVRGGAFTAWSAASRDWHASAFYADEWCPQDLAGPHPLFDLASLTKPLFVPLLFRLRGTTASQWAEPRDWLRGRSLLECLDHVSGAKPWFWMGRGGWTFAEGQRISQGHLEYRSADATRAHANDILMRAAIDLFDDTRRGETVYSDVNAFVLAKAYDRLHGLGLEELAHLNERVGSRFLHASLSPRQACSHAVPFFPYVSLEEETGGSGYEEYGPVHDTNANVLATRLHGVVSGHAGFLGTVADVESALPHLAMGHDALVRELKDLGVRSYVGAPARFRLGLDTPSSMGTLAGLRNFPLDGSGSILGHLGYTGTSFWMRQSEGIVSESHILLTNRVARRAAYGTRIPRLLALTARNGEWISGAVTKSNGDWNVIDEDDYRTLALEHSRARRLLWDSAALHTPRELSDLRKAFGLLAWDL